MESIRELGPRCIAICQHYQAVIAILKEEVQGCLKIRPATARDLEGFLRFFHRENVSLQAAVKLDYVDALHAIFEKAVDNREGLRHLSVTDGATHVNGNQQPGCKVPLAAHILEAVAPAWNHPGTAALAA